MLRRLFVGAALLLASSFQPLFADASDVRVVGTTVVDSQITVEVANPNSTAEPVRIQVAVRVADGSTQVLTSTPVTVPGSATASVSVSANDTVVGLVDEPDPVSP
jgi:hypothetical protein